MPPHALFISNPAFFFFKTVWKVNESYVFSYVCEACYSVWRKNSQNIGYFSNLRSDAIEASRSEGPRGIADARGGAGPPEHCLERPGLLQSLAEPQTEENVARLHGSGVGDNRLMHGSRQDLCPNLLSRSLGLFLHGLGCGMGELRSPFRRWKGSSLRAHLRAAFTKSMHSQSPKA